MLTYYKATFLLGAITAFVVAVLILLEGGKKPANRDFFIVAILSAVWSFGFYQLVIADSFSSAVFWRWFMESGSILLPIWWLKFIYEFLEVLSNKRILILTYLAGGFVWILNFVDLYVPGIFVVNMDSKLTFNYYPTAGLGYYLFSLYFISVISYSLFLVYREFKKNSGIRARQIEFVLFAATLGFVGGGMTFLPTLNVLISPVGVMFFSVYPAIIAYAILKHHLFSLKLIFVEIAVLLLNMFLLLNAFTSNSVVSSVLNISISFFVFLFSIVLMRSIYKDIKDRERIEALVKEMEVANERLRLMEGQKTEFVSIASHQLRTPLTVIKGYASMILEETFGTITAPARDAMEKLYKSSERIVALVEDLLTVSRIEQGRMILNFETVNFKDFVQGVLEEVKTEAHEAQIDLSFLEEDTVEPFVSIDEKKFKQVVRHIIENAIKYTPAPGSVRVAIAHDNIANKIRLIVSDTGSGMTHEQITAIFERFNLKANAAEKEEDHEEHLVAPKEETDVTESEMMEKRTPGIGLYIAQEIIEAHHGTIHIKSAGQGKGTTVVVELPRAEEV